MSNAMTLMPKITTTEHWKAKAGIVKEAEMQSHAEQTHPNHITVEFEPMPDGEAMCKACKARRTALDMRRSED